MAFLGIQIPEPVAKDLSKFPAAGELTPDEEKHVTLLFMGKDVSIGQIAKALEAINEVVGNFAPFPAKIDAVSCFPENPDWKPGEVPIIAKVTSPGLHELQVALKESFIEHGVEFSNKFPDYKPHVTLSYSNAEIEDQEIEEVSWMIEQIVLWGGSEGDEGVTVKFDLGKPAPMDEKYIQAALSALRR